MESIPSNGQSEGISLEILAELVRRPAQAQKLDPALTSDLLLRGVFFTLAQDGSPQAVGILSDAARQSLAAPIREMAVKTLGKLALGGNIPASDALYELAVGQNDPDASQFIRQNEVPVSETTLKAAFALLNRQASEYFQMDPDYRLLTDYFQNNALPDLQDRIIQAANATGLKSWGLLLSAIREPGDQVLQSLHDQFGSFHENERHLLLEILDQLVEKGSLQAKELICQLSIDYEYEPARTLALTKGYAPSSPAQAALFYFLAEQWQIYEYLDFNQSLLASAYESANANLRKRILYLSRYSGRTEWMSGLSTTSRQRWLWDMNDADWDLAIRNLRAAGDHANLWRLAQVAAPAWSVKILANLAETDWQPASPEEQEGYRTLVELATPISDTVPPVTQLQSWPSPSSDISCMALSPDGSYLAVAGSNATIHLWAMYKAPSPLPPIIGSVSQTRSLAFCPDGEYLVAASGDHVIRAFRLSDGKMVKAMEGHRGLVRALVFAPDGRTLFSASFDGSLRAWRFPQGAEIKQIDTGKAELFGLATSPDGQILMTAGSDQLFHIYRWPDGDHLWQLRGHTSTITNLACVPRGQLAATAGRDGVIKVWNYVAGRTVIQFPSEELITALAFHPNEQFILGGSAQGNLMLWNVSTGRKVESLSPHNHPVSGLSVSPDGQQVFSASLDGTISIMDLQLFTWSRTPIGNNRSQTLAQVEQRTRQASQKPLERSWLLFIGELIRWRQRFDVELEEPRQVISVGEFDIEL